MKTRIVRIGNSQGIRIPKLLLEQSELGEEVELELKDGKIVIGPVSQTRRGWDAAFRAMAENHDDAVLDAEMLEHSWDKENWEW